ncbi:MAG TPA: hypothetical protein VFO34_12290 [Candidatus Acidoferrales bacterium]|nr:hypothetical protein [Candidatus Acidoferrales bacterium]
MTLTGTDDSFLEHETAFFLNLVRDCLAFGDGPVKTGNDISIPFWTESKLGHLDLVFDTIQNKFISRYTVSITLHFSKSSVVMLSPSAVRFVELDGELAILAPFTSAGKNEDQFADLEVNFERSTSEMRFETLRVPALIQQMLNDAIGGFVRKLGRQQFTSRSSVFHS